MDEQKRADKIKRNVLSRLRHEIEVVTSHGGRYTSKAYREYAKRLRALHLSRERDTTSLVPGGPEAFQALGTAMAEMIYDDAHRPGLLRRICSPDDPSVIAWREDLAEVDRQVNSVMETVLPYSRHIFYPNKCVGRIEGMHSVPYAKYKSVFVEPTAPFPEKD